MMKFETVIRKINETKNCYKTGSQAIKEDNIYKCNNTRLLEGSIDLDNCLKKQFPKANRWDYLLGYNKKIFYIEVHPVNGKGVKDLIKKKNWLVDWLNITGRPIIETYGKPEIFYWVPTKAVKLLGSRHRELIANKIKLTKIVYLD